MFQDEVETVMIEGCQYSISGTIGEGGAGVVYLAINNKKQKYALKKIKNYTKNSYLKQSVDSQIKIQKMFRHQKYIINCYGQTILGKDIYILFELGQFSLRNKIEMNQLIQHEYVKMLIDVSNGIRSIHNKKMMHRDIKPENIIYRTGVYKITDFGTSLAGQKTNQMAGTCLYWAPQILFDETDQYTQAVDIWSFGVVAFQAYFRIHPFYYDKKEASHKKAIEVLKSNIQVLTKPCFNFQRLIKHLIKNKCLTEAEFIQNKIKNAIPELINTFQGFFIRTPSKRLQIDLIVALFQSLQNCAIKKASEIKQSRVKHKQLPVDVQFFVKALNYCYELNHHFSYSKHEQVQFCLQLGLRFLSMRNYGGEHWIQYHHKERIKKIKQPVKEHFQQIRANLSQYYFYLKEAKQVHFYDKLSLLRLYIIMCSCWNRIFQKMNTVCKSLETITGLQIKNLNDFRQIIPTLTQRQLTSIQNYIISQFYR